MFDSKEIARRALLRSDELKLKKKLRQRQTIGILSGMAATVIIAVAIATPALPGTQIIIDDNPAALSAFPILLETDATAVPAREVAPESLPPLLPGYSSLTIAAGSAQAPLALWNPESNSYWLTFAIILRESGETLYQSDLVEPAMCIENITLARTLSTGEYPAELIIQAYQPGGLAALDSWNFDLTLYVE